MNKNVKFGMMIAYPLPHPVQKIYRVGRRIEEVGFDSLWIADHILMLPVGYTPDTWSILGALSVKTEKIKMGVGVSDVHRRHPAILAQTAATVDQLSNGRLILGLGPGEAMNLDPFSIDWKKKPVSKLVEFIDVMRRLWGSDPSNTIDYGGEFYTLKRACLDVKPIQMPIPIYIGANGPRTRRIAGEIADGWIPWNECPKTYEKHVREVEEGAKKASRSIKDIDTCLQIYTAISDDEEEIEQLKVYPLGTIASNIEKLLEAGYKVDLPEGVEKDFGFKVLIGEGEEKMMELAQYIPEDAADDFSIMGNVNEVIEKIDRFIRFGVKHFQLINIGPDAREVQKIYGEKIIPYFKGE